MVTRCPPPELNRPSLSRIEVHESEGDPAEDDIEVFHLHPMVVPAAVIAAPCAETEVAQMTEAPSVLDEGELTPVLDEALLPKELPAHRQFLNLNFLCHALILAPRRLC